MPSDTTPAPEREAERLDQTVFGKVTWHSSEEDGGPDVGLMLGLGDGQALWIGEISRREHEEGGKSVAALGDDGGWWLATYPGPTVLAKFADAETARECFEQLAGAVRAGRDQTIAELRAAGLAAAETVERQAGDIRELRAEVERLRSIIERDRSRVAEGFTNIKKAINRRRWLLEGRGSYAWDDADYQKEFGRAIQEIEAAVEPLGFLAADLSDSPKDWATVQAARSHPAPSPVCARSSTAERAAHNGDAAGSTPAGRTASPAQSDIERAEGIAVRLRQLLPYGWGEEDDFQVAEFLDDHIATALTAARADERERCERAVGSCPSVDDNGYICEKAAAIKAIRALSETTP